MKMIAFTQLHGLFEKDDEDLPDWPDGENDRDWYKRAGFSDEPSVIDGDKGYKLEIHMASAGATHKCCAVVLFDDYVGCTYVLVYSESDLLALRLKAAPWLLANLE